MPAIKYIRIEPPAQLTEHFSVTFDETMLPELNAYRQARHAFLAAQEEGAPDLERKRAAREAAGLRLADVLCGYVRGLQQEPDDWLTLADRVL